MSMSMSPAATEAMRSASPPSWLAPKILMASPVRCRGVVRDDLGTAGVLRLGVRVAVGERQLDRRLGCGSGRLGTCRRLRRGLGRSRG